MKIRIMIRITDDAFNCIKSPINTLFSQDNNKSIDEQTIKKILEQTNADLVRFNTDNHEEDDATL